MWYLPKINESPVSTAAKAESLNKAQHIATECGKYFISVKYELAITKITLKLQTN